MRQFIVYRVSCIVKICVVISLLLITMNHELSTIYAASATLSIQPASGIFNIGCPFTLDVFLDTGGARTDGTDAILFYDQSRFTAQKIRPGTIYADYPGTVIDATKGRVAISGISSLSSAFAGQGILASIDFVVAADAPVGATQVTFDFDPADKSKTTDSNVAEQGTVSEILSQVSNGSYVVGTGTCGAVQATPTPVVGRGGSIGTGSGQLPIGNKGGSLTPGGKEPGVALPTIVLATAGVALSLFGVAGLVRK